MADVIQAPEVDGQGNITVHGRSGLPLTLEFEDATGGPRDVSAAAIYFEVDGVLRIPLIAGDDDHKRELLLGDEHVADIFGKGPLPFAFRDESGAEPTVFWSGTIRATGFAAQPA